MFYQLFSKYRSGSFETGLNMYDSLAVGLILNPDMFETVKTRVEIETVGKLTTGASLIDLNGYLNLLLMQRSLPMWIQINLKMVRCFDC